VTSQAQAHTAGKVELLENQDHDVVGCIVDALFLLWCGGYDA
jgi:hypothetical protein